MNTDLLTPSVVRSMLGISRQTLWKLTSSGELPVIRLSKKNKGIMRFRQEDIKKFIDSREEKNGSK